MINYFMIRRQRSEIASWFLEPFIPRRGQGHQPDFVLLSVLGILLFVGLLFLSSASSTLAFDKFNDTYYFVKQQLFHGLLPGLLLFYIAIRINYNFYKKIAPAFLLASLLLLLLVFFSNFINHYGTARSWIHFGWLAFQPSEFVKLLFILFLAAWFERQGRRVALWSSGALPFIIILAIVCILLILQPDIGTLVIIVLVSMSMYFAAGANWKHLIGFIIAGLGVLFLIIKLAPYRVNRILVWLDSSFDPQGFGYQMKQSLIAVGSGGLFGVGLGSSHQKSYLPEPANDSIFPIISEEIGFIFTVGFLALFVILLYRGFKIVKYAPDNFAKLTALGITVWLSLQIFINIAGMIKLMPMTGVPLTFVSLGGSNLVASLAATGILANISKYTSYES